jgi:hypothetical protein
MTKPKTKPGSVVTWKAPTWTQWLAWATTLGAVVLAVTPLLPASTPEWVRVTLGIVAVVVAKLTQSERKLTPESP